MSKFMIGAIAAGALGVSGITCYAGFTDYVEPHEMALKQDSFGDGINTEKLFEGGNLYWEGFGVEYHTYPKRWQLLDFNNKGSALEEEIEGYNNEGPLSISIDGYKTTLEISVLWRITDPRLAYEKTKGEYEDYVQRKVAGSLPEKFSSLEAKDLYNTDKRLEGQKNAKELANQELNQDGFEVGYVLVRTFKYLGDYESKITGKVLQAQEEIANTKIADAEREKANLTKVTSEGQANVAIEKARAAKIVRETLSAANRYSTEQKSAGNLLVTQAKARGQQLVNQAYNGYGSEGIVGLQMAEVTAPAFKHVYVKSCGESGANPLDLKTMLNQLKTQGINHEYKIPEGIDLSITAPPVPKQEVETEAVNPIPKVAPPLEEMMNGGQK